jgi:hypothetical protein
LKRSNSANQKVIEKEIKLENVNIPFGKIENKNHFGEKNINGQFFLADSTVKIGSNEIKRKRQDRTILDISTRKSIGYFDE